MQYGEMVEGIFVSRPNRFVATVLVDGQEVVCHVKNTGRCKELLIPGARVWLQRECDPGRKTPYSLITVQKGELLINLDSQAPNKVAYEWIKTHWKPDILQREKTYGHSRFDLFLEKEGKKCYIEVKGVTLEMDGVACFPDAPTLRGLKHIEDLIECRNEGYEACVLFVIQMKGVHLLRPNVVTHAEFGEALIRAKQAGVQILAYDCVVTENSMVINRPIAVEVG
ncbi:MAG: DNA/RNA nuclease SfsA [Lachnospiraceae bacterium]|nr:DNA/RNA nuclease SfsA [Lachnospiraceae bacterium]